MFLGTGKDAAEVAQEENFEESGKKTEKRDTEE